MGPVPGSFQKEKAGIGIIANWNSSNLPISVTFGKPPYASAGKNQEPPHPPGGGGGRGAIGLVVVS